MSEYQIADKDILEKYEFRSIRPKEAGKGLLRIWFTDTFLLKRTRECDDFYYLMNGKFYGEAWDAISRYALRVEGGNKWNCFGLSLHR
jgi:hypothetical protein